MDRIYKIEAAGADPITQWLTSPMHYFEPPINCRAPPLGGHRGAGTRRSPEPARVRVRALGPDPRRSPSAAVGHDPGEPYNVEDVRIRVLADLEHAIVTYRGRGVEIEIPTTVTPSWHR